MASVSAMIAAKVKPAARPADAPAASVASMVKPMLATEQARLLDPAHTLRRDLRGQHRGQPGAALLSVAAWALIPAAAGLMAVQRRDVV